MWSMDKFNDHINKHVAAEKGLAQDWVYNGLEVGASSITGMYSMGETGTVVCD